MSGQYQEPNPTPSRPLNSGERKPFAAPSVTEIGGLNELTLIGGSG